MQSNATSHSESSWHRLTDKASELRTKASNKWNRGLDKLSYGLLDMADKVDPARRQESDRARQEIAERTARRGDHHGRTVTHSSAPSVGPTHFPAPLPPTGSSPSSSSSSYTVQPLSSSHTSHSASPLHRPSGVAPSRHSPGSHTPLPKPPAARGPSPYSPASSSSSSHGVSVARSAYSSPSSSSASLSSATSVSSSGYLKALQRSDIKPVVEAVENRLKQQMNLKTANYQACIDLLTDAINNAFDQKNEILWVRFEELYALHMVRIAHDQMKPDAALIAKEAFTKAAKVLNPIDSKHAATFLKNADWCELANDDIRHGIRPTIRFSFI